MSRMTVAQLEAVVTAQSLALSTQDEAITALAHQLARLEMQVAHLQLAKPTAQLPLIPTVDPCARVTNWRYEYARYRAATSKAPTADDVRAWIRAGRPGA